MDDDRKRMINVFQALGSEPRLKILENLARKNYSTKELSELLKKTPSTISKHLRILKDLGIVWFSNRNGNSIYYLKRKDIFELVDRTREILRRNK